MFVTHAHSFKQQARLAVTLAWVGGYTNILTILACGTVTSHTSGTTSALGHDLAQGHWPAAGFAFYLLAAFYAGALVSGFTTELGRRRGWDSIYVIPMVIELLLLGAFAFLLEITAQKPASHSPSLYAMIALAAAAMGVQNATITRISSGVIRTTHVTGVLTDLGSETAQMLLWLFDRRRNIPPGPARGILHSLFLHPTAKHLAVLAAILVSFALGAGLGSVAWQFFPRWAMFPPVGFLLWIIAQDLLAPIAEIAPSALVGGTSGVELPEALAVYHLRKDHDRRGRVHRMPNLLDWSERLPTAARVVVLDLGEVTELNANAALELRALWARFTGQGRRLIIAGVNDQFRQLHLAAGGGVAELVDSDCLCADLELAIARGINLLEHSPTQHS